MLSRRTLLKASALSLFSQPLLAYSEQITIPDVETSENVIFKTGITRLDNVLRGGLRGGQLMVLCGYAGSGKSLLLQRIIKNQKNTCWLDVKLNSYEITMYPNRYSVNDYLTVWNKGKTGYYQIDDGSSIQGKKPIQQHIIALNQELAKNNGVAIINIALNRMPLRNDNVSVAVEEIPFIASVNSSYVFKVSNYGNTLQVIKNRFSPFNGTIKL